jgi:hypothetical protein
MFGYCVPLPTYSIHLERTSMPERRAFSVYSITGYPEQFDQRLGRCYELAAKLVAYQPDAQRFGWLLVHGTIHGPKVYHEPLGHAWIDIGNDRIWEVVLDETYEFDEFFDRYRAQQHGAYTVQEVRTELLVTKHYGPWPLYSKADVPPA